jgi:hypothetical protein
LLPFTSIFTWTQQTEPDGYGFEMLEQLEDPDVMDNFNSSRATAPVKSEDMPVVTAADATDTESSPHIQ